MKSKDPVVSELRRLAVAEPGNWPTYWRVQSATWRAANPERARLGAKERAARHRAKRKARLAALEAQVAALDANVDDLLGSGI